jgi:hypothetical protein
MALPDIFISPEASSRAARPRREEQAGALEQVERSLPVADDHAHQRMICVVHHGDCLEIHVVLLEVGEDRRQRTGLVLEDEG